MYMKQKLVDLPEHVEESENIELLQMVRRATRTASDMFHIPKGLGFAFDASDVQTVMEERNIVLGRSAVKHNKSRMSAIMFGKPTTSPKAPGYVDKTGGAMVGKKR